MAPQGLHSRDAVNIPAPTQIAEIITLRASWAMAPTRLQQNLDHTFYEDTGAGAAARALRYE